MVGGGGKQCDRILVTVTLGHTDVTFNSEISEPSRVPPREVQDECGVEVETVSAKEATRGGLLRNWMLDVGCWLCALQRA